MLYYLDMVPVPANIQSYLQTFQSPSLTYSKDSSHSHPQRPSSAKFSRNVNDSSDLEGNGYLSNEEECSSQKRRTRKKKDQRLERDLYVLEEKPKKNSRIPRIIRKSQNCERTVNGKYTSKNGYSHSVSTFHTKQSIQKRYDVDETHKKRLPSDKMKIHGKDKNYVIPSSFESRYFEGDSYNRNLPSDESFIEVEKASSRPSSRGSSRSFTSQIPVPRRSKSCERLRTPRGSSKDFPERSRSFTSDHVTAYTSRPSSSSSHRHKSVASEDDVIRPTSAKSSLKDQGGFVVGTYTDNRSCVGRPASVCDGYLSTGRAANSDGKVAAYRCSSYRLNVGNIKTGRSLEPNSRSKSALSYRPRHKSPTANRSNDDLHCEDYIRCSSPWQQNRQSEKQCSRPSVPRSVSPDYLLSHREKSSPRQRLSSNDSGLSRHSSSSSLSSLSRSFELHSFLATAIVVQNYNEILSFLQQDSSNAKRDGLISLQAHLHGMKSLSSYEAVRVKETFNRYFAEPNSKIYSIFLDVLSEFIVQYKNELQDWLFVLLTRLLQRISTDILPSAQTKIARVLDVVRDSYPYDHQFQIITKYVTDNTQTPSLKMKVALLQYLTGLIALMDASDFANTAPIRLAVSRIVTWISEPKSADVRKEASTVIFALFQLNTAEFTNMLSSVPNSIQEGATRVIKTHMKQDTARLMQSTPVQNGNRSESTSHYSVPPKQQQRNAVEKTGYRTVSPAKMNSKYQRNEEYLVEPVTPSNARIRHDSYDASDSFESHSRIPVPHKLSYGSNEPNTPLNGKTPTTPFSYATHVATDDSPMWLSSKDTSSYNPKHYEDSLTDSIPSPGINRVGDGAEHPEAVSSSVDLFNQISTVLSGAASSEASEDIKSALLELLKMMRAGTEQMGGYKLKSLTAVLLKLLKHKEATIRCLTARVLREVASAKADIYRNELRSFILPLLETESDSQKEVSKTAEECCAIVTQKLSSDELFPVIAPLAGTAPYPANVSAIKMLSMVVDNADHNCLKRYLDVVVQSLLKAYDHDESSVRKAAVFCLVSVHNMAGAEHVAPYFKELSGSKVKLLNLYIRRSQSANV